MSHDIDDSQQLYEIKMLLTRIANALEKLAAREMIDMEKLSKEERVAMARRLVQDTSATVID